jgi:hypothetical protein
MTTWRPTPTSFDAEDAPGLVAEVFAEVKPEWWDAPLLTLPDRDAVRDFLVTRHAPRDAVEAAAAALPTPLPVTKRGVLVRAAARGAEGCRATSLQAHGPS